MTDDEIRAEFESAKFDISDECSERLDQIAAELIDRLGLKAALVLAATLLIEVTERYIERHGEPNCLCVAKVEFAVTELVEQYDRFATAIVDLDLHAQELKGAMH